MKISFDTKELLSELEVLDIARDEVRKEIQRQLKDEKYGLENISFYIRQTYIDDILPEYLDDIKSKIDNGIKTLKVDSYMLDRKNFITNTIQEALEQRKSEIVNKSNEALNKKLETDTFYDDFEYRAMDIVVEKLGDVIYESVANKFRKGWKDEKRIWY